MKILLMRLELRAEWVHSLKEKRMVVLSLTKRYLINLMFLYQKYNIKIFMKKLESVFLQ